ncbi:MAG TPA: tyrosine--tRNA ligase [Candidatus Altiarchaeales archaeon]|nr:tyrosine--tRNA ligase [Candidatus Altiarchaeales archaeon]
MADINLIKRNTAEIVTEDELNRLLKEKKSPVTYCGYEVSGPVHIGTMVAVYKQIDFQRAGLKVKVLLADLHTLLNRKGSEKWVDEMVKYWKDCFKALGLKNAEFIQGTEFEYDKNYIHDVLELGLLTTLKRARRSMQEIARDLEHARVSQMIYPLMQIADMKALNVDIAHGGLEQRKIHMLARELLPEINYKKPICIHTPLLSSLQGPQEKMSSSKPETMIRVVDEPEKIEEKISRAYCPPEREGNPILQICEYLLFPKLGKIEIRRKEKFGGDVIFNSYPELEKEYLEKRLHAMDLKNAVAENLIEILEPVREKVGGRDIQ